jgi:hypothetical protein
MLGHMLQLCAKRNPFCTLNPHVHKVVLLNCSGQIKTVQLLGRCQLKGYKLVRSLLANALEKPAGTTKQAPYYCPLRAFSAARASLAALTNGDSEERSTHCFIKSC